MAASLRKSLSSNKSGAVAVEFALLVPILLLIYLSLLELRQWTFAQRQVDEAASSILNVTSTYSVISRSRDLRHILGLLRYFMHPLQTDSKNNDLRLVIAGLQLKKNSRRTGCNRAKILKPFVTWILTENSVRSQATSATLNGVTWQVNRRVPSALGKLRSAVANTTAGLRTSVLKRCADMISVQLAYRYHGVILNQMSRTWNGSSILLNRIACCQVPRDTNSINIKP